MFTLTACVLQYRRVCFCAAGDSICRISKLRLACIRCREHSQFKLFGRYPFMISIVYSLVAVGFLVIVVVGYRWRRSKDASHINPNTLSDKPASLATETDSDIEDAHMYYVWRKSRGRLIVSRISRRLFPLYPGVGCFAAVSSTQSSGNAY